MSNTYFVVCPASKAVLCMDKLQGVLVPGDDLDPHFEPYDDPQAIINIATAICRYELLIDFVRANSGAKLHFFSDQQWIDWWHRNGGCLYVPGVNDGYNGDWTVIGY